MFLSTINFQILTFQESKDLQVSLPKNEEVEDGISETSEQPQNAQKRSKNLGRMFLIFVALYLIGIFCHFGILCIINSGYGDPNWSWVSVFQSFLDFFLDQICLYGMVELLPFMAMMALIHVLQTSISNKVRYSMF